MLISKNERYCVEWRLMNATRVNVEGAYKTLEQARLAIDNIKRSYPVAFACIGKCKI